MEVEDLKKYYNRIDSCSVTIEKDVDFNYIQDKIAKTAIHIDALNTIVGELLIEKSRLERVITDTSFEYKLRSIEIGQSNAEVKRLSTVKEREDFINYFLLKESYKELINIEQQDKDVEKLIDLAKKKARDLDKIYPKLKTLWQSIELEAKYIKKIGSDAEHIERVRDAIDKEVGQPLFVDSMVEEFKNYDPKRKPVEEETPSTETVEVEVALEEKITTLIVNQEEETYELSSLYSDKDIESEVNDLLSEI